jgi:integrase
MAKINLTDAKLKTLKPMFPKGHAKAGKPLGAKERFALMDSTVSGFGVRVTAGGRKTFVLRARYPGPDASEHYSWRALGEYPALTLEQARAKAGAWIVLVKQGKDPGVVEALARAEELRKRAQAQDNTLKIVAEDWFDRKLVKERKGKSVKRDFRKNFISVWGDRPIIEITEDDVFAVIEQKSLTAPSQARNLLGDLKRFFSWTIDQRGKYGLLISPCENLRASKIGTIGKKKKRRRVFSDDEILAFWRATATECMPYPYGPAYRLLMLSALRLNEAVDAAKPEFDKREKIWTVPAERMKGTNEDAREHVVPLTAEISALFDSLPQQEGPYLFSTTHGKKPVWVSDLAKRRLDELMTAELRKLDPPVEFKPFVNHDIRRTVRTRLSRLRIPQDAREAVLAHKKPAIEDTYDAHEYLDEKREALSVWAAHLRTIVEPAPQNVIELHARA